MIFLKDENTFDNINNIEVEEIYDMNVDNLKKLKIYFENYIHKDEKVFKKLNKIYKFVISEIKEREYMNDILDFFINDEKFREFQASIEIDKMNYNLINKEKTKKIIKKKKCNSKPLKLKIRSILPNIVNKNDSIKHSVSNKSCCQKTNKQEYFENNKKLSNKTNNENQIQHIKLITDNQEKIINNDTIIDNIKESVLEFDNIEKCLLPVLVVTNSRTDCEIEGNRTKSENKKLFDTEQIIEENRDIRKKKGKKLISISNNININSRNSKLNLIDTEKITITKEITPQIFDYKKIYSNIAEIFNGYYLNKKKFSINKAIESIKFNFVNLNNLINNENDDNLNITTVNNETEIINDRLRKFSDRLLYKQSDFSDENFYMFKKMLELEKKKFSNLKKIKSDSSLFFKVVFSSPEKFNILCYILGIKQNWRELPHGFSLGQSWNLLWTFSFPKIDYENLFIWQKVNHFINNKHISRKDLLKKAIYKMQTKNNKFKIIFDIIPKTFILSKEYIDFINEFKKSSKICIYNKWIIKPIGKSRGDGIYIINDYTQVPNTDSTLIQKYIINPLLIDGYKFDLRIYVLVTSINPLEVFIYKDGFARISNIPYDIKKNDREIHLTNTAIHNSKALISDEYNKIYGGSKISLSMLKYKLRKSKINFDMIWLKIKETVIKSLIACSFEIPCSPSSFELLGYDILIDTDYKTWLLEINTSPSLETSCVLDDEIKLKLVDDIINILNPLELDKIAVIDFLNKIKNSDYNYKDDFNIDIYKILKGKIPRVYGQIPKNLGRFEILSPSNLKDKISQQIGNI